MGGVAGIELVVGGRAALESGLKGWEGFLVFYERVSIARFFGLWLLSIYRRCWIPSYSSQMFCMASG